MFIAHLPAGFCLTKYIQQKARIKKFLLVGLFASILPDIDLIYFYLFDGKQHLHHDYWIHIPFYWLVLTVLTLAVIFFSKKKKSYIIAIIFFANIFLHLLLDTVVGKIMWLYPFTADAYSLFTVPNNHKNWILNFTLHWTFLIEICIVACSLLTFLYYYARKSNSDTLSE
ncbi:metal-dependent hydrolase [Patescibacteria group bacterium]|nr:metal-dependent hydrolase [Patescibacteria group bacterium]